MPVDDELDGDAATVGGGISIECDGVDGAAAMVGGGTGKLCPNSVHIEHSDVTFRCQAVFSAPVTQKMIFHTQLSAPLHKLHLKRL